MVACLVSARLEGTFGGKRLLWSAAALLAAGTVGLTLAGVVAATIGSILLMGLGGGLLLATVQAVLADHHGTLRTVALAEANVAASISYVVLIGALSAAAVLHAGWRVALLASLVLPVATGWSNRRLAVDAAPASDEEGTALPTAFWVAAAMLMCATAAEWCITAWGATFVREAVDVSTDTAIALMGGYFGGVVIGRTLGSRLARRHEATRLFAVALVMTAVGFGVLWPSHTAAQAVVGLVMLGIGLGNLFPMGLAIAVALVPGRSGPASGRAVTMVSISVLLAPLTIGALADATSLALALGMVPLLLVLAAAGLVLLRRVPDTVRP